MKIIHNKAECRFEATNESGLAFCAYTQNAKRWTLHHTYVPEALRGSGIAAKLVEATLDHIRQEDGRVIPACSYVAYYIQKNPHHADLLDAPAN